MDERIATSSADVAAPKAGPGRFRPSPINLRRWNNFKANRRGYVSFWIFLVLFTASLFAEFIANDQPLLVKYDGGFYAPVFVSYPETEFGGEFKTNANYRDKFVQDLISQKGGWILWAPVPFSYDTINRDLPPGGVPSRPTFTNLLGTDDHGRDVLARVIYGFRLSLLFGLTLTLVSSVIGVAAGAIQGYFGGWTDLIFQRVIEVWTAIPELYLLMFVASVLQPSFSIMLGILLMFSWVRLVGVVRAEFLRARNFEYVQAARALGLEDSKIIVRHLLPNAMVATLTFMPFIMVGGITSLTSLDFLGLGLPPGSPSLGELLAQGKANLHAPWLGLTAFFTMAIMLSLLIFIGEGVRDALDPRKVFK